MPFTFKSASIPGLLIVEPRLFSDSRGAFMESYKASDFAAAGITRPFVQDNHSVSSLGTVRGLHFQRAPHAQGKLVRVTRGRVWDVAVDLRKSSPNFGTWEGVELSALNWLMLWIPAGFAHGFVALEEGTELQYKCTDEYAPSSEGGIRWDDPTLGIEWPIKGAVVSEKDGKLPAFDAEGEYFD
jgi:dTDP-4-dehydrorhamnose 3,5-epimerase